MRIRLTDEDLRELAMIYRSSAAGARRSAEKLMTDQGVAAAVHNAKQYAERADKLERLAKVAEDFLLIPAKPFDGGPPSLMVVGGSTENDGSAFTNSAPRRRKRTIP